MNNEPFLIGYARVSTDDQDLSLQVVALEKYGVPPDQIIREHHSGGTMNRPQWNRIMQSLREGDVVVIWKLDRLGRTLLGIMQTVEEMHKRGVHVIALQEGIDTRKVVGNGATAMGRAFFSFTCMMAELERGLISERTKAGIAAKRDAGGKIGRAHSIADHPGRLEAYRELTESGSVDDMDMGEILEVLNASDVRGDAKPILAENTLRNWINGGCRGLE